GAPRLMDGLRRIPAADIETVESDPVLEGLIRDEIAATGPMTFARFMELALDTWSALDKPERFTIREHGAGSGALAKALVEGLGREAPELAERVRYRT